MRLRKYTPSLIWLCLLCALVFAHGKLMTLADQSLPDAMHVRFKNSITIDDYLTQKLRFEVNCIGFTDEYTTVMQPLSYVDKDVNIIATESPLLTTTKLRLLKGSFFMDTTDNAAIISEDLAKELYLTADIIGAEIDIGGYRYKICGVFTLEHSMISQLSQNGMEDIYIPLRSDAGRLAGVDHILINVMPATDLNTYSAEQIRKLVNSGAKVSETINYSEILAMVQQSGRLKYFFIAVVASFALFTTAFSRVSILWHFIHNICLSRQKTIRDEIKNIIYQVILCAGLVLGGIVMIKIMSFQPTLPVCIADHGNSFNPSFYVNLYTEVVQRLNSDGANFWMHFSYRILIMLYFFDLCVLVAAVGFISGVKKVLKIDSFVPANFPTQY